MNAEKVRENRLRRMAKRQELILMRSRRRDPYAADYGGYQLVNYSNYIVFGEAYGRGFGASLDDIEDWLTGNREEESS